MRRDSIFYALFQQAPTLLFALLDEPPSNADQYRFDAVAVKEARFEIDGVFLPPESDRPGVVYFCEVQFQKDERLYERLFAELFLYFYRQRDRFCDWQAVVIYPSRSVEQSQLAPYRVLLDSPQVQRVFLDELGALESLPLGLALMVLTTLSTDAAPTAARSLIERAQAEVTENRAIIELLITIMVYKFTHCTRQEIEAMLGIALQQTRVYQDAKAEGEQEGEQRGRQEGRREEARSLVLRLLTRRLGELPESTLSRIDTLSLHQLEALGEALLDFTASADLEAWLQA